MHEFEHDDGFKDIKSLMEILDNFQKCFRDAVQHKMAFRLRQTRNAWSPTSKLPVQLMQDIFYTILLPGITFRYYYMWYLITLRSVSVAWRDIIDRTPMFWTNISSEDHSEFIYTALERSEGFPLTLECSRWYSNESELAILDQALPQHRRWESVTVKTFDNQVFKNYLTYPAPRLKKMMLMKRPVWENPEPDPLSLFGGSWESVEEVALDGPLNLDWRSIRCRRLRTLGTEHCKSLELAVIIGIIQENEGLEDLKLCKTQFISSPATHPSKPPVTLSHLKLLGLKDLDFTPGNDSANDSDHPAFHIFKHIRFPHCTYFFTTVYGSGGLTGQITLKYLTDFPSHPPNFPSLASLAPSLSEANFLEARLDKKGVTLKTNDHIPQRLKLWLKDIVTSKLEGATLEIKLTHSIGEQLSELDDVASFQDWDAVTEIFIDVVWDLQQAQRRLLQMLATPYASASGAARMPFPSLRGIEVPPFQGDIVLKMIMKRFSTPGVAARVPETVFVKSWGQWTSFTWPDLGGIQEIRYVDAISFAFADSSAAITEYKLQYVG
ncbi:hypothetical protein FS837_011419 [Tulasnella sp. UAMH 9824]|nr:hypothetical protein FS837_011419 [Tulasnella sp. UAMH 9824]